MIIKRIYICVIFILLATNASASEVEDFDIACQIFTEAKNTVFDNEIRSAYIEENIKNRTKSKELRDTYNVIFNASPEDRYRIFKDTAEHITKKSWDCPAAKALFTLGKDSLK